MDEYRRHRNAFAFFHWLLDPFLKLFFNYSYDKIDSIEGPYFLMCNHNTDLDPLFLGLAAKNQIYFVASEHVTRGGLATKLLMRYFKPIIHKKGRAGAQSTIEMLRTLKQGHNVCIFPEGNRSFNGLTGAVSASTGKLVRRSGVKLVTYRLEGGYFTQPRWGHGLRRGKLRGRLINVYTAEQLRTMTDAQVTKVICSDINEDAYADQGQQRIEYTGRNLALGLETAIFACPKCGDIGALSSSGQRLSCSSCGFFADYLPTGFLRSCDGEELTVTGLDAMQRSRLAQLLASSREANKTLFSDDVTVNRIATDHTIAESVSGRLSASPQGFFFNDQFLPPSSLGGAAIYGRNSIIVFVGKDAVHYEVRGTQSFNALKYLYIYNLLKDGEE